jgi:hypothetical protein
MPGKDPKREDGRAYPVLAWPPLQRIAAEKWQRDDRTLYVLDFRAVVTSREQLALRTTIYITAPRTVTADAVKWTFLLATVCVPASLPEDEVVRVREVLFSVLFANPEPWQGSSAPAP